MRVLAISLLALAACVPQATAPTAATANAGAAEEGSAIAPTEAPAPDTRLDPAKSAIIAADKAEAFGRQCSRISPGPVTGTWAPAEAAVRDLEINLADEIERHLAATSASGSRPEDYYRQYAGLLIDGRQIIYVNGLHADAVERAPAQQSDSWKTAPATICDGGTITFGVEYDPATKTFANFVFNGAL